LVAWLCQSKSPTGFLNTSTNRVDLNRKKRKICVPNCLFLACHFCSFAHYALMCQVRCKRTQTHTHTQTQTHIMFSHRITARACAQPKGSLFSEHTHRKQEHHIHTAEADSRHTHTHSHLHTLTLTHTHSNSNPHLVLPQDHSACMCTD
jgi:hypothetical protein